MLFNNKISSKNLADYSYVNRCKIAENVKNIELIAEWQLAFSTILDLFKERVTKLEADITALREHLGDTGIPRFWQAIGSKKTSSKVRRL